LCGHPDSGKELVTIPVVGIGASAGGLEAFKLLLAHVPVDTGLAFVFVQHLDPKHTSNLSEILTKVSAMPVRPVTDGVEIEPNRLYVIPPDAGLEVSGQVLRITPRAPASLGPHMPIDHFLRTLAQERGSRAIGVILSGAGTDGAAGLEAVKAAGGTTFAQDPSTAKFDGMPQAAIGRGCVDFVLSPEAIAAELTQLGHHPYIARDEDTRTLQPAAAMKEQFDPILALLRDATGVDFALYRENTVRRRIMRRLALRNIGSLEEYRKQIESDPRELSALHRDLLINVTSFFRDPESFESLKKFVFPRLVQDRTADAAIRIWVPGCATGEEAYSIAISLQEYFGETGRVCPVQIFATDISGTAIEKARTGKFPETIASDVGPERLDRYFSKVEGGYQINKTLREMCVFSRHDLIQDPPFSKLDLISCRNLLIFFGSVRKNVIALFHYALRPDGFLLLGSSETESGNLFSVVKDAQSLYTKHEIPGNRHPLYTGAAGHRRSVDAFKRAAGIEAVERAKSIDLRRELEGVLLSRYSGAGVVVDETLEVLEILGQTAPYLALPSGKVSLNLLKLIPDTRLFLEIEKLVRQVEESGQAARKERVPYQADGASGEINAEVIPLGNAHALLVLFEAAPDASDTERTSDADPKDLEIATLKQLLTNARQRLVSIVEEHHASREDDQNTTAEALSANEELQSLNEELETAKEELQSTNEELTTVNQELISNNAALLEARDFAMLIIETAAAPLLVLDTDLRIKTANPAFYRAFHISPDEVEGRILYSLANGCWDIPRLREVLERVLPDRKVVHDFEFEQDFPGIGHRVLGLNARQLDGLQQILLGIDDVTSSKERDLRLAAIIESSDDAILSKTLDGKISAWNSGAETMYGYAANEVVGRPIMILAPSGYEDEMARILESIRRGEKVRHLETKRRRKDGQIIDVSMTISPMVGPDGVITGASIVARDITEVKRTQEEHLAKQKLESVGTLASGIAHDFNNLLGGVLAHADLALAELTMGSTPAEELERIRSAAIRGAEIVRQLMIYSGKESEVLEPVDVSRIVEEMLELLRFSVSKHAALETDLGKNLPAVRANPGQLRQVVMNLITNASDAIGDRDGLIRVKTACVTVSRDSSRGDSEGLAAGDYLQLEVSDTGRGMTPETQARIFDPFFTTKLAGHGLGLAVVQGIVRSLRGTIRITSAPGKGTTFHILLPCVEGAPQARRGTAARAEGEPPGSRQATVLIVEDENLLRQAASKMLRKKGFSVIEASDGNAALDLLRAHKGEIDVLLLDVTLPGLSSREVLEEGKRLRPDLPVIVTSANSEEMAAAALGGSVEHFIRKPFGLDHLIGLIRESLSI
jgi:two-component system CheB/CheR fusion protein